VWSALEDEVLTELATRILDDLAQHLGQSFISELAVLQPAYAKARKTIGLPVVPVDERGFEEVAFGGNEDRKAPLPAC